MNFWKIFLYRFDGLSKTLLFYFSFFDFDDFLTAFPKNLIKMPAIFMIDIKSLYELLLCHKDLRSRNFWQWNDGSFLKICTETCFHCLFSLNEKVIAMCHLMIHIKCVAAICFNENWSSLKRPFWNNGQSNMVSHFFRFFTFSCFFAEKFMKKLLFFNINF